MTNETPEDEDTPSAAERAKLFLQKHEKTIKLALGGGAALVAATGAVLLILSSGHDDANKPDGFLSEDEDTDEDYGDDLDENEGCPYAEEIWLSSGMDEDYEFR